MKYYKPNYGENPDSPFARDADEFLVRKNYWYDMTDETIILLFNNGIGKVLTNEEKILHLKDIKREYLIKEVCVQEILPAEK